MVTTTELVRFYADSISGQTLEHGGVVCIFEASGMLQILRLLIRNVENRLFEVVNQ